VAVGGGFITVRLVISLAQSISMDSVLGGQRDPLPDEWFMDFFLRDLGHDVPSDWRRRLRPL
jgi:hypothetical protein